MISRAVLLCLLAGASLTPIDETGYRALIASQKNKVLLVDFWATWCEPCRAELPAIAALGRRLAGEQFLLATISTDEPEQEADARKVLSGSRLSAHCYIRRAASDDRFINSVDANWSGALPALFLYDRSGRLARSFTGEIDMEKLEIAIRKLL